MRKNGIMGLLAVGLLCALCLGGAAAQEREALTLWVAYEEDIGQGFADSLVADFQEHQQQYEVVPTWMEPQTLRSALAEGLRTGDLPDMVWLDSADMAAFAAIGLFEEVTELLTGHPAFAQLQSSRLESALHAGAYYGVPLSLYSSALYYNDTRLGAKGISGAPEDWAAFRQAAVTLSEESKGVYGFALPLSGEEGGLALVPWLYRGQASLGNLDSGLATLLQSLHKNGALPQAALGWSRGEVAELFLSRRAAVIQNGPWMVANLSEETPDLAYTVSPLPLEDADTTGGVQLVYGHNLALIAGSREDGAGPQAFLAFCLTEEPMRRAAQAGGLLPARKDLWEAPYWSQNPAYTVFLKAAAEGVEREHLVVWNDAGEVLREMAYGVLSEIRSPAQATEAAQAGLDALIRN